MAISVRNGRPNSVTVRTTPYDVHERLVADFGLYAQDTWTIKRFTVNAGIRFDLLNAKVEEQEQPGGTWIGPRSNDEIPNVPNWKDLGPRLGIAYDLFGNGKTALKATLSRYVGSQTLAFAGANNPLNTTVNTATRTWNDHRLHSGDDHAVGQQPAHQRRRDSPGQRDGAARQHVRPADRVDHSTIQTRRPAGSSGATTGSSRRASRRS